MLSAERIINWGLNLCICLLIISTVIVASLFAFERLEKREPLRLWQFTCADGQVRDYFFPVRDTKYEGEVCDELNWREIK